MHCRNRFGKSLPAGGNGTDGKKLLGGGAAINVFCRQHNIALTIVDGVVKETWTIAEQQHKNFVVKRISAGTASYLHGPAMSMDECLAAMEVGKDVVKTIAATGCNTIGFSEKGIGNTSSAALFMSSVFRLPVEDRVGRGTGANAHLLRTKIETLQQVAALHNLHTVSTTPEALLAAVGGFEIAALRGAFFQPAEEGMVILVDGFITSAALLCAYVLKPVVRHHCVFAHCSGKKEHRQMLDYLGAIPLLQLGLRLGEGTGAALAFPLVQSAVTFLGEMASFAPAGVDQTSI